MLWNFRESSKNGMYDLERKLFIFFVLCETFQILDLK